MGETLVEIVGNGFRVPTPSATGNPNAQAPSTVRVTFGVDVAPKVLVISDQQLVVLTPKYSAEQDKETFSAIDVKVENLDDSGVLIPTEEVVSTEAYTFEREPIRPPTLDLEGPYVRIARRLIQWLKREVLLESGITTHTDYSRDGISIADSSIPSLFLVGPTVMPDAYGAEPVRHWQSQGDGTSQRWPAPEWHTVGYELVGHSDHEIEFETLMGTTRKFFRKNPYLLLESDVPPGLTVRLPMIVTSDPEVTTGTPNENRRAFTMAFEVRRIPVLYLPPTEKTWEVASASLQAQELQGTLVETKTLW